MDSSTRKFCSSSKSLWSRSHSPPKIKSNAVPSISAIGQPKAHMMSQRTSPNKCLDSNRRSQAKPPPPPLSSSSSSPKRSLKKTQRMTPTALALLGLPLVALLFTFAFEAQCERASESLSSLYGYRPFGNSDDLGDIDTVRMIQVEQPSSASINSKQSVVYTTPQIADQWPAPLDTEPDLVRVSGSSKEPTIVESGGQQHQQQNQKIIAHSIITVHTAEPNTESSTMVNGQAPPHNQRHRHHHDNIVTRIHPSPAENTRESLPAKPIMSSEVQLGGFDKPVGVKYLQYFPSLKLESSSSPAVNTYDTTSRAVSGKQLSPYYDIHRESEAPTAATSHFYRASPSKPNQYATRRQSSYSVSDQCALLLERPFDGLIQGVGSGLNPSSSRLPGGGPQTYYSYRSSYTVSGNSPLTASWGPGQTRVKRHQLRQQSKTENDSSSRPKLSDDGHRRRGAWNPKYRITTNSVVGDMLYNNNNNNNNNVGNNSKRYPVHHNNVVTSSFAAPDTIKSHRQVAFDDRGNNEPANNDGSSGDPLMLSATNVAGVVNQVCITFDHVNEALERAKRDLEFQTPDDLDDTEPSDGTLNVIGELNQLVTEILADRFDLSYDEILNGLPMIDIKQTNMWNLCPTITRQIECMINNRYRSITGHCNNLNYPTMGAANTPFVRYVPPDYADGVGEPRVSIVDSSDLPSARQVVSLVHQDHDHPSNELSLLIMSWGQLIDHDMALATPPSESTGHNLKCCPKNDHSLCLPIRVPADDPKYAQHNIQCLEFKRSLAGVRPNCVLGPRTQLNAITSAIDANFIYGTSVEDARELRAFRGGQLRTWNYFSDEGLKPLLPPQQRDPDVDCVNRPSDLFCFVAGDVRVNEQIQLTSLHVMHVREHNRIANILQTLNGHWSDERVYQETRHIMAAMIQHILLAEYLPALIGQEICAQYNLTEAVTYWDHYDQNVDIGISNSFSTAAFRQGHTFVQGVVRRYNNRHELVATHQLRNLFRQPWPLFQPGAVDEFVLGLVDTPAQSFDPFLVEDISGHLFQRPGSPIGFDLPSINIQRAREQGVPGYNTFREWCGLPRAYSFLDLAPYISNFTAYQYSLLYKHVDDIDLFSGGLSEQRLPGAQVGPTFACIIARQFSNLRRGDRFWFENSMMASSFIPEQLIEIKKTSLARILCTNSDNIQDIQRSAFHLPHPVFNERIPCVMLPDIDFRYWQEAPPIAK